MTARVSEETTALLPPAALLGLRIGTVFRGLDRSHDRFGRSDVRFAVGAGRLCLFGSRGRRRSGDRSRYGNRCCFNDGLGNRCHRRSDDSGRCHLGHSFGLCGRLCLACAARLRLVSFRSLHDDIGGNCLDGFCGYGVVQLVFGIAAVTIVVVLVGSFQRAIFARTVATATALAATATLALLGFVAIAITFGLDSPDLTIAFAGIILAFVAILVIEVGAVVTILGIGMGAIAVLAILAATTTTTLALAIAFFAVGASRLRRTRRPWRRRRRLLPRLPPPAPNVVVFFLDLGQ